jgi:hypothetical protein
MTFGDDRYLGASTLSGSARNDAPGVGNLEAGHDVESGFAFVRVKEKFIREQLDARCSGKKGTVRCATPGKTRPEKRERSDRAITYKRQVEPAT